MVRFIVKGQRVNPAKVRRTQEFRRNPTPAERIVWHRLRANRLAGLHFRRQQIIRGFIVDFYCHTAGAVVEVDGSVHRKRKEADRERDAILTALGLRVLRVTNAEVFTELEDVLARIYRFCVEER